MGLRISISYRFPGAAAAAGPDPQDSDPVGLSSAQMSVFFKALLIIQLQSQSRKSSQATLREESRWSDLGSGRICLPCGVFGRSKT